MISAVIRGSILATKNQIDKKIWITDTIQIPRATFYKQNCLRDAFMERK